MSGVCPDAWPDRMIPAPEEPGMAGSDNPRCPPDGKALGLRPSRSLVASVALMTVASAPTLFAVVLAQDLYGRSSVALVAVTFTVGSLAAHAVATFVERAGTNSLNTWLLCAFGMVVIWPFAGVHLAVLCAAQLLSGLCMTALEGLIDAATAARAEGSVTGALARATAGRAMGSAAGLAVLPFAVVSVGLAATTGAMAVLLAGTAAAVFAVSRFVGPGRRDRSAGTVAQPVWDRQANGHWPEPGLAPDRLPAQPSLTKDQSALPHP